MARKPKRVAVRRAPPQSSSAKAASEWINVVFDATARAASGLVGVGILLFAELNWSIQTSLAQRITSALTLP
jgi:hypothetical protein